MFRSYSDDVIASMMDRLLGIIRRQGPEVLLNAAIAGLPDDLRDNRFCGDSGHHFSRRRSCNQKKKHY